jgi:acetyl-CoA C-acetyltransferase
LGSLKTVTPDHLAAIVIKEAVKRSNLAPHQVGRVIMGNVLPNSEAPNIARIGALLAGMPEETPAFSVDMQCGSALQAVRLAAMEIQTGACDAVVAGGTESMSRALFYLPPSVRYEGFRMGNQTLTDAFMRAVSQVQPPELYPDLNMGITAENIAALHGISREQQDAYALDSQKKACSAIAAGRFKDEIASVQVTDRRNNFIFEQDEYPKADATLEGLAKLKPVFKKDGSVTAGNASGMNDGASAVVVMSGKKAKELGVKPLVRILQHAVTALDPKIMGLGPVTAITSVLRQASLTMEDIALFEINEAFAVQALGVLKELGMLPGTAMYSRVNVNGGAVALGHALGSSGTRILTTLIHELKRRAGRYGVASLCIGGGQGIAILVENI